MQRITIVIPTFQDIESIGYTIDCLEHFIHTQTRYSFSLVIIDRASSDGTLDLAQYYSKKFTNIHILKVNKKTNSYKRACSYAASVLRADCVVIVPLDCSFSIESVQKCIEHLENGIDYVVGSVHTHRSTCFIKKSKRYAVRQLFLKHIAGITDCSEGFLAFTREIFPYIPKKSTDATVWLHLQSMLKARRVKIAHVSLACSPRTSNRKRKASDHLPQFITACVYQGLLRITQRLQPFLLFLACFFVLVSLFLLTKFFTHSLLITMVIFVSTIFFLQGLCTLAWMLYAWENPDRGQRNKSPRSFVAPRYSFSAIIPARHEEKVIADTLSAVAHIAYPEHLKEVLVICRKDDVRTIARVEATIQQLNRNNIRLVVFDDSSVNKPHALNVGLQRAKNDVVAVFDAEDEPHADIYHIVNTVMVNKNADVVQSGVQLINYATHWFSLLNVMEYYFWFKSALHVFSRIGSVPLGGNTVFFKKKLIHAVGGWDEHCLTEDADMGIRLSLYGAKISVIYDEHHATREETPVTTKGFIRQRTRWNQGFIYVLLKGDWLKLPKLSQKLATLYVLIVPEIQALMVLYAPVSLLMQFKLKLPVPVAMYAILPSYLLILQLIILSVGFYEFIKQYGYRYNVKHALRIFLYIFPFQLLLCLCALRAIGRIMRKNVVWEKTLHLNAHRGTKPVRPVYT